MAVMVMRQHDGRLPKENIMEVASLFISDISDEFMENEDVKYC